jgi:two-component system cell cycle sensor histidine kinase/response regulator CckA
MADSIGSILGDEHRYRLLVEHSLGFMAVHDLQGFVTYVSPPAAHALGRTAEDMIGRSLRAFLAPSVQDLFDGYLDRIRGNGADSGLMLLLAKDGTEQVWQYRNVLLTNPGASPQVYGHAIDVTERVRAEQELRRAQREIEEASAQHQSLVEGSALGVCIHQDGLIRFANRTLATMHGYDAPEDVIGKPFVTLLATLERGRVPALAAALLAGERVPENQEVEHVTRQGRTLWAETWSSVVLWNGSLAVLVTVIDATERKRLEARVGQIEKVEAVARLAGGVAHECSHLMAVVLERGTELQQSLEAADPRRGGVQILVEAAERVALLAQQLLAHSRSLPLRLEQLDLAELVEGLAPRLRDQVPPTVSVTCMGASAVWPVEADRVQIEEAIAELAANAGRAMIEGGTLVVEASNVMLDEAFVHRRGGARMGPHVVVTVQDTGVGMAPEVQKHAFEPFFTTRPDGEATGLGLASVYGIVKQHGGYVELSSTPGKGATVRMYFPRAEQGADAPSG